MMLTTLQLPSVYLKKCKLLQATLEHRLPKSLRCIHDVSVLVRFLY